MKSHKKLLSLVTAVIFCLTFLAPVLVAPAPAMAASTYTLIKSQNVSGTTVAAGTFNRVQIQIDVANVSSLRAGDEVSIHLPSDVEIQGAGMTAANAVYYNVPRVNGTANLIEDVYGMTPIAGTFAGATGTSAAAGIYVVAPASLDGATTANKLYNKDHVWNAKNIGSSLVQIKMQGNWDGSAGGAGRIVLNMQNVRLISAPANADLTATIAAPPSSGFSSGSLVFGKYVSSATGTTTMMKSIKKISSGTNQLLDSILIQEAAPNALDENCYIKLKLPAGFKWTSYGVLQNEWGFGSAYLDANNIGVAATVYATITEDNGRTLKMNWFSSSGATRDRTKEGRIIIGNATIQVDDESVAKKGDVLINISDDKGKVTVQDFVAATYADYTAEVKEGTAKEVVAGKDDVEIGDFTIKEGLGGSLLGNRKVTFTLPSGARWDDVNQTLANVVTETNLTGSTTFAGAPTIDTSKRVLSYTITQGTTASEYKFEKSKVRLSPDFTGDLVVEVGGTAGVTGKAKVATVLAPAALSAETTPNIVIGAQAQKVGTILIKETKKEAFASSKDSNNNAIIKLSLPTPGFSKWADKGTVTVSDGDAVIDKVLTDGADMNIYIKSTSSKPATIKIEGATVTPDRAVPEGDFQVSLKATWGIVNMTNAGVFDVSTIAKAVIAKVVTPAPTDTVATGANGAFTINSNVMMVNGQYRILDASPYIKAGRTYVPVRAMSDALAATTNWDAATQTVTVTKGDKTVVLVIGNTVAKVNGADVTMDVAPEINNGRTMLPARYVAEGLGFQVQWNAATQQVVFGL